VNDLRVGRIVRAVRQHQQLRQSDVALVAGVDQSVVSDLENGRLEHVSLRSSRRIAAALGVDLVLDARWHGGMVDRLLDRRHAALVEVVVRRLAASGWLAEPEFTFNEFGDRGSVDVLGWHPAHRALLLVEVKTELTDLQAMLMAMSKKVRVVPPLVARERGWDRHALGRLLVVAGTTANRTIVRRHATMFGMTFPQASREAQSWLRAPEADLAALWFVTPMAQGHRAIGPRRRVQPPRAQRLPVVVT
jgi:transcriptional regulator with XRE-family HTH domain